jgi:Xaa-Pro aminopeptidase
MKALLKVQNWLQVNQLDGVLLSRRDNYAWITGGRRNQVVQNQELGTAALLVTPAENVLFTDTIDGGRIYEEETGIPVTLEERPWFDQPESFLRRYIGGKKIVSDSGLAGTKNVQNALIDLRLTLNPTEERLYRMLGKECAEIVEDVCLQVRPGMTENQAAHLLQSRCIQSGVSPDCVLAGGDERIEKYRHPMPTDKEIKHCFMLVLGGERQGLNISLTRMVYFEDPSDEIRKRYGLTQKIFAAMQNMTTDGMKYKDFFRQLQDLYAQAGYPDEWQKHHQGGPTGYACREKIITPEAEGSISLDQTFAWNPTITGTKCEETTLLTQKGIEILTRTEKWPVTKFETRNGVLTVADILVQKF